MDTKPGTDFQKESSPTILGSAWLGIRRRILGGILLVLPILITLFIFHWLYLLLEKYVIDPLARIVLYKIYLNQPESQLPPWFELFAAPLIGIFILLVLLYTLGFFVQSGLRQAIDWVLLRVPVVSLVYKAVRTVINSLEKKPGQQKPQRVVLVPFPHPGMKVPAFVTSSCRDIATQKVVLCVYVPTTPVPTSGYFLMILEEDVTELNWTSEEALQTIISGGFTAPPEVGFSKAAPALEINPAVARLASGAVPDLSK